jgi:hypothetical protein
MEYVLVMVVVGFFLVLGLFAFVISRSDIKSAILRIENKQFGTAELNIKKK